MLVPFFSLGKFLPISFQRLLLLYSFTPILLDLQIQTRSVYTSPIYLLCPFIYISHFFFIHLFIISTSGVGLKLMTHSSSGSLDWASSALLTEQARHAYIIHVFAHPGSDCKFSGSSSFICLTISQILIRLIYWILNFNYCSF